MKGRCLMKASSFIVGRELEICLFAVKFEISPLNVRFRRYIENIAVKIGFSPLYWILLRFRLLFG
jgi:hypothetical protein